MQQTACIITFLRSVVATRELNENGRFSAHLELARLMSERKIVVV